MRFREIPERQQSAMLVGKFQKGLEVPLSTILQAIVSTTYP